MENSDSDMLRIFNESIVSFVQCCQDPALLTSPTINPYWDKIKELPGEKEWGMGPWQPKQYVFGGSTIVDHPREELVRKYSFAIPDPVTLQFVAEHSRGKIVEQGSGMGYWAWQLAQFHVDIIAYDTDPPDAGYNFYHNKDNNIGIETYYSVIRGMPEVLAQHADRTCFLCWPPYGGDMAYQCLRAYTGNRLIYIGEGSGGCTGDDAFHTLLENDWEEIATHRLVQWEYIHDWVYVYERVAKHIAE